MVENEGRRGQSAYQYHRPRRVCVECLRNYGLIIELHKGKVCPNCGLMVNNIPMRAS